MLELKGDIFPDYTVQNFKNELSLNKFYLKTN